MLFFHIVNKLHRVYMLYGHNIVYKHTVFYVQISIVEKVKVVVPLIWAGLILLCPDQVSHGWSSTLPLKTDSAGRGEVETLDTGCARS